MDDLTPARIWRDAPLAGSPEPARMAIGDAQRTLWAAYRLAPEDPSYNMVLGGRLVGGMDPDILAEAFRIAISEREALHTAYREDEAGTIHMVRDPGFAPDVTITHRAPSDDANRKRWFEAAIDAPFVLENALSCRVRILVEGGTVYFATVVHHIAGDFASVELLCERAFSLAEKLRDGESPAPRAPGDFWRWLERQRVADRSLDRKKLEGFWRTHLAQAGGPPRLFSDPAPGATVGMGEEIDLPLGPELSTRIHDMAKEVGISPLSLLTAGYQLFLHRWSGQDRFVIGTPVSGRHRRRDADLVGYTINVLPWVADFGGDPTGSELARAAHHNLMSMLRHRQLPTGRVLALKDNEFGDEKPAEELIERLRLGPRSWRKFIYSAEGHFCAAHVPARNDDEFGMNIAYGSTVGAIDYDDFDWLLEVAADTGLDQRIRAAAFRDALYLLRVDGQPVQDRVAALRDIAKDQPSWFEKLEQWLVPAKPDRSYAAQEAKWKKQAAVRKAKEAAAVQTWLDWRQDILRDPDAYFAKTSNSRIVWDFAQVLERDPEDLGWRAHWNGAAISAHFDDAITERVRAAFCAYWRTIEVPLRSERPTDERNTVWSSWIHALAGVCRHTGDARRGCAL